MKTILIAAVMLLFQTQKACMSNSDKSITTEYSDEPKAVLPVPSKKQVEWQKLEFYAFFHYGMNTFKGREWGLGNEKESEYSPATVPDCKQWVRAIKAAGMRGAVFVAKHHDGFCMWPTKTTTHSVLRSSGAGPRTDIMRLGADACKEYGIKMGVYLSPWDRNNKFYGTREYADHIYFSQLNEICTKYGPLFEVWFDGANGGTGYYGGNVEIAKTINNLTYYNWHLMRDTVKAMQPDAMAGRLEFRWVGNEEGFAGVTNWSPITENEALREKNLTAGNEFGDAWIPAESDAKATDKGWFWHKGEKVLPAERLYQMYLETVGRNATLILNVPPSTAGVLPEASVDTLARLGTLLKQRLSKDLAKEARITASVTRSPSQKKSFDARNMLDEKYDSYWATPDKTTTASITLEWKKPQKLHYIELQEYIPLGQRVKSFSISTSMDGKTWTPRAKTLTTTIGYKRIVPLNGSTAAYGPATEARFVKIEILGSKACVVMNRIAAY